MLRFYSEIYSGYPTGLYGVLTSCGGWDEQEYDDEKSETTKEEEITVDDVVAEKSNAPTELQLLTQAMKGTLYLRKLRPAGSYAGAPTSRLSTASRQETYPEPTERVDWPTDWDEEKAYFDNWDVFRDSVYYEIAADLALLVGLLISYVIYISYIYPFPLEQLERRWPEYYAFFTSEEFRDGLSFARNIVGAGQTWW